MLNVPAISRNIGYALLASALFMLASVGVSVANGMDSGFTPLLISFLLTFIVGFFPFIFVRKANAITLKEGYIIITLSWILSFIFGMLPYILWGGPFTVTNAWFESVSGYTTTGATILSDIEALPKSLLFWRSATHFVGGLGVVVFLLLVIPDSSPVKMRLTNMELSSLSKSGYASRPNLTVYIFASVYVILFLLATVSYIAAGMSPFDAVNHAFSVCATGGFSTRNLSIGAFGSKAVETVTMVFMFLSSVHFGMLFMVFATRSLKPLKSPVLRFFIVSLLLFGTLVSISLYTTGQCDTLGRAFEVGFFQTMCVSSTSGFAIADNADWPMITVTLLLVSGVMCGCAGSTTGGIKVDRVLILFKSIKRQIGQVLHPSAVNEVKIGGRIIKDENIYPHIIFIALFTCLLAASVLLALLFGVDGRNAFAASVTSFCNVGPAFGELGNYGSFDGISSAAKILFTADMFLGRVEIYPVIAVIAMILDSKRTR